jgi:hypothetical protein
MGRQLLMGMLLGLSSSSCGGGNGGPGQTGEPPDPPFTTGGSITTGTTTGTTGEASGETGELACGPGQACPAERFCAAVHQAGLTSPPDDFVCMHDCVPAGSTSYWCLDDSSCCGEATCHVQFGLCELPDAESSGDTTSTGDTGSTGKDDDASSGDSGTSTGGSSATTAMETTD